MKKVLLILLLLVSCAPLKYNEVVIEPFQNDLQIEKSKNELYVIANEWMISIFNDAESVIQFSDKEEGILSGKYLFHIIKGKGIYDNPASYVKLYALLKIQVKYGATRITVEPYPYNDVKSPYLEPFTKEMALEELKRISDDYFTYVKNYNDDF